jgi:hypothetical protein
VHICRHLFLWQQTSPPAGTSKQNVLEDDDDTSSESSSEDEAPRTLSYRTPLVTQASNIYFKTRKFILLLRAELQKSVCS